MLNRGPAGVPRWIQAADHHDAVVLATWCWWEERRRERRLLRQGVALGLSATELGAPLGIRSRQGVRDRLDRLDALLTNDRPDEQLGREARRGARRRDADQSWLDQHRGEVRAVLLALVGQAQWLASEIDDVEQLDPAENHAAAELGDIRDWTDELAADCEDDVLTPATLALAGLLAAEIRAHPSTTALDPRHRVHTVLAQIERLRSMVSSVRP